MVEDGHAKSRPAAERDDLRCGVGGVHSSRRDCSANEARSLFLPRKVAHEIRLLDDERRRRRHDDEENGDGQQRA